MSPLLMLFAIIVTEVEQSQAFDRTGSICVAYVTHNTSDGQVAPTKTMEEILETVYLGSDTSRAGVINSPRCAAVPPDGCAKSKALCGSYGPGWYFNTDDGRCHSCGSWTTLSEDCTACVMPLLPEGCVKSKTLCGRYGPGWYFNTDDGMCHSCGAWTTLSKDCTACVMPLFHFILLCLLVAYFVCKCAVGCFRCCRSKKVREAETQTDDESPGSAVYGTQGAGMDAGGALSQGGGALSAAPNNDGNPSPQQSGASRGYFSECIEAVDLEAAHHEVVALEDAHQIDPCVYGAHTPTDRPASPLNDQDPYQFEEGTVFPVPDPN